jgi:hypothetical protein
MIETFLLLLFTQCFSTTNAQNSVQPPNCYYSANQTLASVFLPCGDPQNGFKSCCEAGDNCLADNACYSADREQTIYYLSHIMVAKAAIDGTTYLAGCTDPEYSDSSCPDKPDLEGMCP